jgi:NADPH2:quinone reductase
VEAAKAVPIPDDVEDESAAAVLMQGVTAHYLATDTYPIGPSDPVLIHAAASGVGQLLVQVAKLRGCTSPGRQSPTTPSPPKNSADAQTTSSAGWLRETHGEHRRLLPDDESQ